MSFFTEKLRHTSGQASVEASFLIPVMFILLLLLVQPGILLYNHMVMQAAASEGCRLLATKTDAAGSSDEKYEGYVLRRLGAIPPQDNFHVHNDSCSWEIELQGNESSERVQVTIKNQVKFLPLFDMFGSLFNLYGESGTFTQEVTVEQVTQPEWVRDSEFGIDPQQWIENWS